MEREEYFLPGEPLVFLRCAVSAGLLAGLFAASKAFVGTGRNFPRVPLIDSLPQLPAVIEAPLFILMCVSLVAIFFGKRIRLFSWIFTVATAVMCAFDQTRFQPWLYEYTVLLLIASSYNYDKADPKQEQSIFAAARAVLVGIYFYAGLQKLNTQFGVTVIPWLFQPVIPALDGEPAKWVGTILALFELSVAFLLLFRKTRDVAVLMAAIVHIYVLFLLMHHEWNQVVWPWNISMTIFVVLLFFRQKSFGPVSILIPRSIYHVAAVVLFVIMPALNFIGRWDYYPSAALYSGNIPLGRLIMEEETFLKLPPGIRRAAVPAENKYELPFENWSFDELSVPPYPEVRVLKKVGHFTFSEILKGAPCTLRITTFGHFYQDGEKSVDEPLGFPGPKPRNLPNEKN